MKNKELLEEIVEEISKVLPDNVDLVAWIDDADRMDLAVSVGLDEIGTLFLGYQWGRLLGCAEWANRTVLELLDDYDVAISKECSPGCLGWAHFNVGVSSEGIERCDECDKFEDDFAATKAHDKHCRCGAGVDKGILICHACGGDAKRKIVMDERAFCSKKCAVLNSCTKKQLY